MSTPWMVRGKTIMSKTMERFPLDFLISFSKLPHEYILQTLNNKYAKRARTFCETREQNLACQLPAYQLPAYLNCYHIPLSACRTDSSSSGYIRMAESQGWRLANTKSSWVNAKQTWMHMTPQNLMNTRSQHDAYDFQKHLQKWSPKNLRIMRGRHDAWCI